MKLEDWLDQLEHRFRIDGALVAQGMKLNDRLALMAAVRHSIFLRLKPLAHLPENERLHMVEAWFLGDYLGRRLRLSARQLASAGNPRKGGKLSHSELVCLWLAMLRHQSLSLAGLWDIYPEFHQAFKDRLPEIIAQLFAPQDNDEQAAEYVAKILQEIEAHSWQIDDEKQTSKIVAWVLATRVEKIDPTQMPEELSKRKNKLVGQVDINLLRGKNTLMDAFIQSVYEQIDGFCKESDNG